MNAKTLYTVALSNQQTPNTARINRDFHGEPIAGSRCYRQPVRSLLDARKAVLAYIKLYKLTGTTWTGGKVFDLSGKLLAEISFNGRIWANRSEHIPYDPIAVLDVARKMLTINYQFFTRDLELSAKELLGCSFKMMDPIDDNKGLEIVLEKQEQSPNNYQLTYFSTRFVGGEGWKRIEALTSGAIEMDYTGYRNQKSTSPDNQLELV